MCNLTLLTIEAAISFINISLFIVSAAFLCRRNGSEFQDALSDMQSKKSKFMFGIDAAIQNANSNLNFNKTLQWNYVYYVVLLFSALIAAELQFGSDSIVQIAITVAANGIFHVGLYLQLDIQFQIRRERISLINISMRIARDKRTKEDLKNRLKLALHLWNNPYITVTLLATVFSGYVVCIVLIIINTLK